MLVRLLLAILLLVAGRWVVRRVRRLPRAQLMRHLRQAALWGVIGLLGVAVLTGHLNPLVAALSAAIPALLRLIQFLRLMPELQQLLRSLGLGAGSGAASGSAHEHEPPPRADSGVLTEHEARAILGLDAHADAEAIRAAHRRLMQRLHPDRGGSDYLAARINAAKRRLLGD